MKIKINPPVSAIPCFAVVGILFSFPREELKATFVDSQVHSWEAGCLSGLSLSLAFSICCPLETPHISTNETVFWEQTSMRMSWGVKKNERNSKEKQLYFSTCGRIIGYGFLPIMSAKVSLFPEAELWSRQKAVFPARSFPDILKCLFCFSCVAMWKFVGQCS